METHPKSSTVSHIVPKLTSLLSVSTLAWAVSCSCGPSPNTSYSPPADHSTPPGATTDPGAKSGTTDPSAKGDTRKPPEPHKPIESIKFPDPVFKIPPKGNDGYHASNLSLAVLGQKMDDAAFNTKNARGEAETSMDVGGATLIGKSLLQIKDGKTFKIEYYMPETEATLNKVIADGTRRATYYLSTWKVTNGAAPAQGDASDELLKAWPNNCLRSMFADYETGKRTWEPLLSAWSRGRGGYSATIEEQRKDVLGKERTIYQVLANRKTDGAEVQIVVDGERFLPLTVRSVLKNAKGGTDRVMWSATWKFGGQYTGSEFEIPVNPAGP